MNEAFEFFYQKARGSITISPNDLFRKYDIKGLRNEEDGTEYDVGLTKVRTLLRL